jgi:hypothetical protein
VGLNGLLQPSVGIGRRDFIVRSGGLLVASALAGCGDTQDPEQLGFVQVQINGLAPGATSFGTAVIGQPGASDQQIILPASSGTVPLPAGTYSVVYQPPVGYQMAPGNTNARDVVVIAGETGSVEFAVVVATGTISITVAGLTAGAPSGGSALCTRTDLAGTSFTLVVSSGGSASGSAVPGDYSITYSPPAGYQLASGSAATVSRTVNTGATANAVFTVTASAPVTGFLFHSDWSTATGLSDAALRDTSKALPWDIIIGSQPLANTCAIVPATGLDFPSTNVFQVNGDYAGPGVQPIMTRQVSVLPGNNHWPIPAVGQSLFFRLYKRVVYPVGPNPALGNNNHCIEEQGGGGSNWSFSFDIDANGWRPKMQSQVSTRFYLSSGGAAAYLARNQTYRLEWQVHRISANTCNLHMRIYNSAGTLLYSDANFVNPVSGQSLANTPTLTLTNAETLDGFQVGTNGPGVDPGGVVAPMWYIGCCAVRAEDWCGPYAGGI